MQKTPSFYTIVMCMVSSANIWVCGVPPSESSVPDPPPMSTPTATPTPDPTPSTTPTPTPEPQPRPPATPEPSTAGLPSDLLDLDDWYLTLPTGKKGSPNTVRQPALDRYRSDWFRLNEAKDGVVFMATAGGTTTKNSGYPRSELREMTGSRLASWSNTSGSHTLTVRQAVRKVPPKKPEIVTAQIHDAEDDVMQVRLEGRRLKVQYDDGAGDLTIDPAYVLGTVFDLKIVAADRRVEVFYNGTRKAVINRSGSGWYFKSGTYLQTNTSKGDAATAGGEVVIYALDVTHSNGAE